LKDYSNKRRESYIKTEPKYPHSFSNSPLKINGGSFIGVTRQLHLDEKIERVLDNEPGTLDLIRNKEYLDPATSIYNA